jgi:hypothetical protein
MEFEKELEEQTEVPKEEEIEEQAVEENIELDIVSAQIMQEEEERKKQEEKNRIYSPILALMFIIMYSISDIILPLYNKILYSGKIHNKN